MTDQATVDTATNTEDQGVLLKDGKPVTVEDVQKQIDNPEDDATADRPEWLPERFKTPEDLAKSYSELEKTLKEKGKVAPDEYTIDDAEKVKLNVEDESYKAFIDVAKTANLTNAQFNAVINHAAEMGIFDAPNYEAEKAKLGAEAEQIVGSLQSFAATRLNKDEQAVFESLATTAAETKLLYKLIRMGDKQVPARPGENAPEGREALEAKLQTLLASPDIRNNMQKKQEAERLATAIASMK